MKCFATFTLALWMSVAAPWAMAKDRATEPAPCGIAGPCGAAPSDSDASAAYLTGYQRDGIPENCIGNTLGRLDQADAARCEQFIDFGTSTRMERAVGFINLSYFYLRTRRDETGHHYFGVYSAERALTAATVEAPQFTDVWLALADLHIEFTKPYNALLILQRAEKLAPNDWRVYDGFARYFLCIL